MDGIQSALVNMASSGFFEELLDSVGCIILCGVFGISGLSFAKSIAQSSLENRLEKVSLLLKAQEGSKLARELSADKNGLVEEGKSLLRNLPKSWLAKMLEESTQVFMGSGSVVIKVGI